VFDGIIEIRRASDHVVVMTGVEDDKLLKLKGTSSNAKNYANLAQQSGNLSSILLWHARFGHINYDSLILMKQKDIQGLPTIPKQLSQCDACILGKHSKQPFHDSTFRASRKLGLIHSDLCGPMHVPSTNGNKYLMTFIDDYTRMCWVYLLKEKSQAFDTFKNFHLWIKNETQLNIGTLRSDNGGEYTSKDFEKYLQNNGIKHQTIVPYNPQQNGVAERMNRTLLNMVRSMMFFKNVKLMFWGEAVLCVVYIKNRSPSATLHNKSPYEMWHGHLPVVKHLRIFGSTCYALIPEQQRNKLEARSRKCIFLGYSNTSKAYRLYDEENKKFILSRDVIFLEFDKAPLTVDKQLARLDRFHSKKFYHEWDNDLPNLEGGIPVLDQSLEFQFPSTTSSSSDSPLENEDSLNDNRDSEESEPTLEEYVLQPISKTLETEQSLQQPVHRSTRIRTFPRKYDEFVTLVAHADEFGKTETRSSARQSEENAGDVTSSSGNNSHSSYDCELNLSVVDEPASFQEATTNDAWRSAMQREYDALIKNGTWRLVDPPFRIKPIGCKWVYKNKYKVDGSLDKHKARLVAKGYAQKEGVDYTKTFSPTTKWGTIRTLFSLATQKGWKIHHMDVKTSFLNGDLKEDVYMTQPEGFTVKGQEQKVCKLVKYLYGLKQAPRAWYEKLTEHLLKLNYKHFNLDDATLFVKKVGKSVVYLVVYVDDLLITGNNDDYIASIKKELKKVFDMTDLGLLHYYLGIEVTQNPNFIFISQKKYIGELLCRFGMQDCNPVSTPMEQNLKISSNEGNDFEDATKYRQLVGSLIYLTTTRPDITFAVGILSRFMHQPCEGHWVAAKRVLKYLKGTHTFGLKYSKVSDFHLIGYSDSDFDGDKEHGVSTSGYLMCLGSTTVTWRSRKQSVLVDSTTEAEYVATTQATKEIVWLRKILEDLQEKQLTSTPLLVDNTSTIQLAKNPIFHDRTKHINTKYHLIRHHVEAKTIHLRHCSTSEQMQIFLPKLWDVKNLNDFECCLA
jgi:transposase InsO family protein